MTIELRKMTLDDGRDIYEMLQEIPRDENGFINKNNGRNYEGFKEWLKRSERISKGIGLEEWMVPGDVYWLFVDGIPVGQGKLRHRLTEQLLEHGGHIGYAIRPSQQRKGYGTLLLKLMLKKAKELKIERVLVTTLNHNIASQKVALRNGGIIERMTDERTYIWIEI